jgi:HlyD family secretion protein
LKRAESLARTNTISARALEKAKLDVQTNEAALASAKAQIDVRRSERASVAARLIDPTSVTSQSTNPSCCIQLRAPVTGVVLKIVQDSEAVVLPGTPLVEIGDPTDIDIDVELLSAEAVRVLEGADASIEAWGGGAPLRARIRRVEPSGFTKVSALGIEEQRVRVILDLASGEAAPERLGHDYRIFARITTYASADVLRVPVSALFRKGDAWAVFVADHGRARVAAIEIGERNATFAEVRSGVKEGLRVILHPSDRVGEGVAVVGTLQSVR